MQSLRESGDCFVQAGFVATKVGRSTRGSIQGQEPVVQLMLLSDFSAANQPESKASFMKKLCSPEVMRPSINGCLHNIYYALRRVDRGVYSFTDIAWTLHAWRLGVFEDRFFKHKVEAAVLLLPERLQRVACLAVGIFLGSDDNAC